MYIGCEDHTGYPDYYWIKEVDTIDELNNHIKNKTPIKCKEIVRRYYSSIVLPTDSFSSEQLVYLSNYNKIWKVNFHYMEVADFQLLEKNQCTTCKHSNDWGMCRFTSTEPPKCNTYKEEQFFSILNWIKRKLMKVL